MREWTRPSYRLFCVVLLLGLVSISACRRGSPPQTEEQDAAVAEAPIAAEPAPVQEESDMAIRAALQPWTGDLDGMVERRYIRILVTFSKTNYFLDKAEQRGATYEGGKKFEEFVNERLKSKTILVNVMFIPVTRDRLIPALLEGQGDVAAANLTITSERQALVDFSVPLLEDARELVVTGPGATPVATVDDLAGREVHVRRSSSYYESLLRLNESLSRAGKPPVQIMEADELLEDEDILEMVQAGVIPATIVDSHIAEFWEKVFDQIRVHHQVAVRTGNEIAWAFRKGSPKLREMVDEFVATHGKGTLFGNVVYQRYLKNTKWVLNPTAAEERKRFQETVDLFRKYGDQYDLPWLLVAAQAYQESRIDQSVKSQAGAVGVMQIKPSTAEGPPVFIRDVDRSVENNIHAGVKYLRFIVDEYYKDEPMDRVNKGLMAVASYNAGPARIARLRKKTAEMGLDPNKWFGNVEVAAAKDIGRETVQYVSNIYKYYVTYNLLVRQMEEKRPGRSG